MHFRAILPGVVAVGCVFVMTPLGCGGAQDEGPRAVRPEVEVAKSPNVEVPEATVRQMEACVHGRTGQWVDASYALQYDTTADAAGNVLQVKLRDATVRDAPLEACFERAITAMAVPADALRLRSSKPFSGGENMSASRASLGIVQAVAVPIALAPIVITALGVTIVVAISIDIIRKATSGPDCKQVKTACITYCSDTTLPTPDFGWKFQKCKNECLERQGCPRDS